MTQTRRWGGQPDYYMSGYQFDTKLQVQPDREYAYTLTNC